MNFKTTFLALSIFATSCQAAKVTITPYNQPTDEKFARHILIEVRKSTIPNVELHNSEDIINQLNNPSTNVHKIEYVIRVSHVPVGLLSLDINEGIASIIIAMDQAYFIPDIFNLLKKKHPIVGIKYLHTNICGF